MKYLPNKGQLFYVSVKSREFTIQRPDKSGTMTLEKYKVGNDDAYANGIFRCRARDDTVIIASVEIPLELASHKGFMFKISNYEFSPVGPDVAKFYNLVIEHDD